METLAALGSIFVSNSAKGKEERPVKTTEYKTEFHQISHEFINDLEAFRNKYPLITLIATLALGFFGLMNLFSFSPTNILTGAFLITLSVSLGTSIVRKGFLAYFGEIKDSIGRVLTVYTAPQKPEEGADKAKEAQKAN